MTKKQKELIKKAEALGYVTFEDMHRKHMKSARFRNAYEATRLEYEIRRAIIQKRIQNKLTQAQVAKRAKLHQSAVARFETSEESPTLETTSRIFAAVGAKIKIS